MPKYTRHRHDYPDADATLHLDGYRPEEIDRRLTDNGGCVCVNCRWFALNWSRFDDITPPIINGYRAGGVCRRRSPVADPGDNQQLPAINWPQVLGWPRVNTWDWCGEFAPNPDQEGGQ